MESNTSVPRLGNAALSDLDPAVDPPTYDRSDLVPSIVHIGVGGFHRAHLAKYIDELLRSGNTDWAILGTGVLPGDARMADALLPQDGLYTLIERGADSISTSVIGSMIDYIHAHPDSSRLIDAIASPTTQIVSLTVTEGGYPVDDATGDFDPDSRNAAPGSGFAAIIAGLQKRMANGVGPVTLMSCDNVMGNGHIARTATMGMIGDNAELAAWVNDNVAFPNSMVDRITPATTAEDRAWFAETYPFADDWPVVCEPFIQWVVEDNFAGARLPLEDLARHGVTVTNDIEPFEHMKLQLLNAGHICLAYPAALLEFELVHEAMADDDVRNFMGAYLNVEAKTALPPIDGMDFDAYIAGVIERFSNPQVRDQIGRLNQDATGRFPKFVVPTVRAQLASNGPIDIAALLFACWRKYLLGTSDAGNPIAPEADPFLEETLAAAQASVEDPAKFLDIPRVFDKEIAENERFINAFVTAVDALDTLGVRAAINQYITS